MTNAKQKQNRALFRKGWVKLGVKSFKCGLKWPFRWREVRPSEAISFVEADRAFKAQIENKSSTCHRAVCENWGYTPDELKALITACFD